jgi:hypothetical protein
MASMQDQRCQVRPSLVLAYTGSSYDSPSWRERAASRSVPSDRRSKWPLSTRRPGLAHAGQGGPVPAVVGADEDLQVAGAGCREPGENHPPAPLVVGSQSSPRTAAHVHRLRAGLGADLKSQPNPPDGESIATPEKTTDHAPRASSRQSPATPGGAARLLGTAFKDPTRMPPCLVLPESATAGIPSSLRGEPTPERHGSRPSRFRFREIPRVCCHRGQESWGRGNCACGCKKGRPEEGSSQVLRRECLRVCLQAGRTIQGMDPCASTRSCVPDAVDKRFNPGPRPCAVCDAGIHPKAARPDRSPRRVWPKADGGRLWPLP